MRGVMWVAVGLMLTGLSGRVAAEEPAERRAVAAPSEGSDWLQHERERLERLRRDDLEAFHAALREHQASLREGLERLRRRDPERSAELEGRLREYRRKAVAWAKTEHPEVLARREQRLQRRLDRLREVDPERYEVLRQRQLAWRAQRLERLKSQRPQAYERFVAGHPEWQPDRRPPGRPDGPGTAAIDRPGARGTDPSARRIEPPTERREPSAVRRRPPLRGLTDRERAEPARPEQLQRPLQRLAPSGAGQIRRRPGGSPRPTGPPERGRRGE